VPDPSEAFQNRMLFGCLTKILHISSFILLHWNNTHSITNNMTVDRKNHKEEGEEEKKQEEVETPEPGTPWVGK
jgi:hypothetical protein